MKPLHIVLASLLIPVTLQAHVSLIVPARAVAVPVATKTVYTTQTVPNQDPYISARIYDLITEIKDYKDKRTEFENKVDAFYERGSKNNPNYAFEIRKIHYYEDRIREYSERIKKDQDELDQLNRSVAAPPITQTNTTVYSEIETAVVVPYSPYYRHYYYPTSRRNYHYHPTPPPAPRSNDYYQKRGETIRTLKNR